MIIIDLEDFKKFTISDMVTLVNLANKYNIQISSSEENK